MHLHRTCGPAPVTLSAFTAHEEEPCTCPEFRAVWYGWNLKIFANILNGITGAGLTIFVWDTDLQAVRE